MPMLADLARHVAPAIAAHRNVARIDFLGLYFVRGCAGGF
jgi:hypothetical protein